MAKFDLYDDGEGEYWLDCQADVLSALNTRLVVPLRSVDYHGGGDRRLNPHFTIAGREMVLLTHFASAIPANLLRHPIGTLIDHEYTVGAALDVLISGF